MSMAQSLSTGCEACGLGVDVNQGTPFTTGQPTDVTIRHFDPQGKIVAFLTWLQGCLMLMRSSQRSNRTFTLGSRCLLDVELVP